MSMSDARAVLERLIRERGEDYAGLSRLIGRNPAYIQQFIKRGSPRKLAPADRETLARYFGVSEDIFDGAASAPAGQHKSKLSDTTSIPRLDVGASAGHGASGDDESQVGHVTFDSRWLRQLCRPGADLSFIRVQGDSMIPALVDGDDILVDHSDAAERLRDGIYVLRRDDMLTVKRLAVNPVTMRVTIKSDNSAYPDWPDCNPITLAIIGRVIWAGRKVS